jgi:hypothetical protein
MQHKSVIFVVISLLIVAALPLTYTTVVTAAPPEQGWHDGQCSPPDIIEDADGAYLGTAYDCCWTETDPADPEQIEIYKCQFCYVPAEGAGGPHCDPPRPGSTAPPTTGENIVPGDTGVLEQPPTFAPFDPTAPLQGGVLEQPPRPPPAGPAAPLQGGVLEQLEQGKVTPGFVPGFLQRQEQQPPADQETGSEVPRTAEPLPPTCTPGSVFDPDINECVLENPPELCPDGSIPQLTGPGGTQPECPPSEAEEPQAEEPEQPAEEGSEQQQSSEEGDGS